MKTKDFYFELPDHLIAQHPPEKRGQSRLMVLDRKSGTRKHLMVEALPEILKDDKPLLVFNDTKVRKARITGKCINTGKEKDFLLLEQNDTGWKAMAKRINKNKIGNIYDFYGTKAVIAGLDDDNYLYLNFKTPIDDNWLDIYGHMPLPPYIKRQDTQKDASRYQTIYAKQTGAAAAPTAGLHFTEKIFSGFSGYGIETAYITLHVGLGTFLPVRSKNIEDHKMHKEEYYISEDNADKIEKAKSEGRKIIAVGTTSLRTLESAIFNNKLKRGKHSTSIFIYPGFKFKITDALFTNFHTPFSTLLMLVSAFAGKDLILESYNEAVKERYRFFSYGDAMLII